MSTYFLFSFKILLKYIFKGPKASIPNNSSGNNRRFTNTIHQPLQKLSRKTLSIHVSESQITLSPVMCIIIPKKI